MKLKILLSFFLSLCFQYSCKTTNKSTAIIRGTGFGKEIVKVYLTDAHKWDTLLDSARCVNGNFEFNYGPATSFEPFLATLSYIDSNGRSRSFFVRNQVLIKKEGKNHSNSGFMLDYGVTSFKYYDDRDESILVDIKGGTEQDLFMKYDDRGFGYVPLTRNELRKKKVNNVTRLIRKYPFSFYFLRQITSNRLQYSKQELIRILGYFDDDVQHSRAASLLKGHIENSLDVGENTRPLSLVSNQGSKKENINRAAKLNMLIFWASWCGPCRLEIPQLKQINELVKDKNFYMASISVDKKKMAWYTALSQEKMGWDQFILNESERHRVMSEYAFSSIPMVVFTDKNGKELARFTGYSLDHVKGYKKLITENLGTDLN